ncbi:uncharacterized protein CcaverHIS019_0207050 [Cutaneotrichosporon cavernicola]|uniref:Major facilitator superfamily (MFS) profile domain-containing protein n=1 Tax=Cutaneotrichosporon cavernicola TaxID=279322 RepID=A0AA48IIJ3_9TREE|nr:uncharacterized protein CcaverHIS019_0207050 [Cutaneotrichosporon cavernicola]BEI89343.1 hypothetical protein CcaverHIS019_0207050 [Cutaneotrichosporon cavernicola]BEI97118.1 hypothetical protein CcaverHIS631_0207070 [Cutaneotrichosporon cavernicola]
MSDKHNEMVDTVMHMDTKQDTVLEQERVHVTEEQNRAILRKTDKHILVTLMIVYFMQALDKTNLGIMNLLGLSKDLGLKGTQYSLVSSVIPFAQMAWQPFSSYLVVRVDTRVLMTALIVLWGTMETILCAANSYASIMAIRFFLGLFEAGCLPLFSVLTAQWYRRSEQPLRVALWYGTNGLSSIMAAVFGYGFAHLSDGGPLFKWQGLAILCGGLTLISAPLAWFWIDSTVDKARFLTVQEKELAKERLRANQTGVGNNEYKWNQLWEVAYDPKSYLFVGIAILINAGAAISSAFGPTLINNMGFDKYISNLLNIPFGALQLVIIVGASWVAQRFSNKAIPLAILQIPCLVGSILLYTQGTSGNFHQGIGLFGYYLLSSVFGCNPLLIAWVMANTGGQTKKSALLGLYQCGAAAGNILGPMLFNAKDAPYYIPGLRGCMGIFAAQLVCVGATFSILVLLNRQRRKQRIAAGKPEFIRDTSMENKFENYANDGVLGKNALDDLTDFKNDEFVYVY